MIPELSEFEKTFGLRHEDVKNSLTDCRLEHLLHIFEGYRSAVQNDPEDQPYSKDSARDISYQIGRQIYEHDVKGINFLNNTPIIFPEF